MLSYDLKPASCFLFVIEVLLLSAYLHEVIDWNTKGAFFKTIQDWIHKSKRIRKWILRFFAKLRNRRIHSGSGFFGSVDEKCLVKKRNWNPFSDSFGFKNPTLDFLKETHPYDNRKNEESMLVAYSAPGFRCIIQLIYFPDWNAVYKPPCHR